MDCLLFQDQILPQGNRPLEAQKNLEQHNELLNKLIVPHNLIDRISIQCIKLEPEVLHHLIQLQNHNNYYQL